MLIFVVCFDLGFHTSTAGAFATDSSFSNVFGNQNSTLDATGKGPDHSSQNMLISRKKHLGFEFQFMKQLFREI